MIKLIANKQIKELRKYLGLTLEKFGERLGVKKAAVSKWENGDNLSEQMFKSICREFNVNENWLRTGEGEMFNYSKSDSLIEIISAEYNLDSFQKKLVQKYLELTNQQKAAVKSFLDKIYQEETIQSSVDELSATKESLEIPPEYADMSIEEMINRANLLEDLIEKRQALNFSQKETESTKMA